MIEYKLDKGEYEKRLILFKWLCIGVGLMAGLILGAVLAYLTIIYYIDHNVRAEASSGPYEVHRSLVLPSDFGLSKDGLERL